MTCPKSPDGVHRKDPEGTVCRLCGKSASGIVESQRQPAREPIRAAPGAWAYGATDERRRDGDE
jgi:hypothetical protein